jgi:hypothetical protein
MDIHKGLGNITKSWTVYCLTVLIIWVTVPRFTVVAYAMRFREKCAQVIIAVYDEALFWYATNCNQNRV